MPAESGIRYVTTSDGQPVAYLTLGEGRPLVIPPTGPWATIDVERNVPPWWAWYSALASHFTVVRYDGRGTGYSGNEPDFTLESRTRDLAAVVDTLELDSFSLLAMQTAGPQSIAYTVANPGRVERLVLWCTTDRGVDAFGSERAQMFLHLMSRDPAFAAQVITRERFGWQQEEIASKVALLIQETINGKLAKHFMETGIVDDVSDILPDVSAPTLVIHRRALSYPSIQVARRIAAGIPAAQLVEISGSSVAPFVDGDEAEAALQSFLGYRSHSAITHQPRTQQTEQLTAREIEVLRHIADGASNQEIADALFIGVGTVKTHINSLLSKLGAANRTRAVSIARELGLLS